MLKSQVILAASAGPFMAKTFFQFSMKCVSCNLVNSLLCTRYLEQGSQGLLEMLSDQNLLTSKFFRLDSSSSLSPCCSRRSNVSTYIYMYSHILTSTYFFVRYYSASSVTISLWRPGARTAISCLWRTAVRGCSRYVRYTLF